MSKTTGGGSGNGQDKNIYGYPPGIVTINGSIVADQKIIGTGGTTVVTNTATGVTTITGGGGGGGTPCAFKINSASAQSIPDGVNTLVQWATTPTIDTTSGWSSSNNYFTCTTAGYYVINSQFAFTSSFAEYNAKALVFQIRGSTAITIAHGEIYHPAITALGNPIVSTVILAQAGDHIAIYAFQNSGASLALDADSSITNFSIQSINTIGTATTPVVFMVQGTTGQPIGDGVATEVVWNTTASIDTNGGWTNTPLNSYIIPTTGYYQGISQILFDSSFAEFNCQVQLDKYTITPPSNTFIGAGEIYHPGISAIGNPIISTIFHATAGDLIHVYAYQSNPSPTTEAISATNDAYFIIYSIGI